MRQPGFYWVRNKKRWVVAEWVDVNSIRGWLTMTGAQPYDDIDFEEIGPMIEPPKEGFDEGSDLPILPLEDQHD